MPDPNSLPWMKWYPHKWLTEPTLKMVSLAAKGLWIDMLNLMWAQGGVLRANGKPFTVEMLANNVGAPPDEVKILLKQLLEHGVCDQADDGAYYCRYMAESTGLSITRAKAGSKGGKATQAKIRLLEQKIKQTSISTSTSESISTSSSKGGAGGGTPRVFEPQVEELYALGVAQFADAGHKTPSTPKQVETAKDCIRLMIERDEIPAEKIRKGLEYVASDTGNDDWPGWRAVCLGFPGLRKKWDKIGPQVDRPPPKPKRQGIEIQPCDRDGAKLPW